MLLLMGMLMVFVGRWFARADAAFLLETVREAVDGTVAEKDPDFLDVDHETMQRMKASTSVPRVVVMVIAGIVLALGVLGGVIYAASGGQP